MTMPATSPPPPPPGTVLFASRGAAGISTEVRESALLFGMLLVVLGLAAGLASFLLLVG